MDAGFGTYENVVLLIEMGHEVYTKAHNHRVATCLKERTSPQTTWTRVGANAKMVAWESMMLQNCSYPLDVGLERFYFIRWATHWLASQVEASPDRLNLSKIGVKRQVQVGTHVSAQVIRDSQGRLLKFSEHSAFAGKELRLHGCDCSPPCKWKSYNLGPFFTESHLITQPLR